MAYIKKFIEVSLADVQTVGGKNASLAELFNKLKDKGINVQNGFAITCFAYEQYIDYNNFRNPLQQLLSKLDTNSFSNLVQIGHAARKLLKSGSFPNQLKDAIIDAYKEMFGLSASVAVRSSASAEDLPQASFAGQHDSYLNVRGIDHLLDAVRNCFASLYNNRAIKYRHDNGFDTRKISLSVGIQEMVRSDLGSSGVGFTLEPESGFAAVVHISGVWGLGENLVQGTVIPDEFIIYKPALKHSKQAILQHRLGSKAMTMTFAKGNTKKFATINKQTPRKCAEMYVLTDTELETLGRWAMIIEEHYHRPMDFEWAKDGINGQLYILQARPVTVYMKHLATNFVKYSLEQKSAPITSGLAIGKKIASGRAKHLMSPSQAHLLKDGDILIADATSPDWDPVLNKVAGVVTNQGGRTSHAAIVARELGAVAIVGTQNATKSIPDGAIITLSCAEGKVGKVYAGKLDWNETTYDRSKIACPGRPKVQMIVADPDQAFELSFLSNDGIGLLRLEFMISNYIGIHPMALLHPEKVTKAKDRKTIQKLTKSYASPAQYFIDKMAEGIATIAAAFAPKEVVVRLSDFKSNEYAALIGGYDFEHKEENPMIGLRGASRYYHESYREAFALECNAIRRVREGFGLTNVKVMIPFCRTPEEGQKVIELMRENGLEQGVSGLEILVMAEIPANVVLAEKFAAIFDGFSIGSNDLTQLTLGVDRDSAVVADLYDENSPANLALVKLMIESAKNAGKYCGLCGQAASDSNAFLQKLIEMDIDGISFNADALLEGIENINRLLKKKH